MTLAQGTPEVATSKANYRTAFFGRGADGEFKIGEFHSMEPPSVDIGPHWTTIIIDKWKPFVVRNEFYSHSDTVRITVDDDELEW